MQTSHNNQTENITNTTQELVETRQQLRPRDVRHVLVSMRHAMRWSQMKRRFEKQAVKRYCKKNWSKAAAAAVILGFGIKFVKITPIPQQTQQYASASIATPEIKLNEPFRYVQHASYVPSLEEEREEIEPTPVAEQPKEEVAEMLPTVNYSNKRVSSSKKNKYIDRFGSVVKNEMKKYNVPASILLGIAALNSNFGQSPLAKDYNNHTGMLCENIFIDETTKAVNYNNYCHAEFQTAWSSFRALSLYLSQDKLSELKKVAKNDYQVWASGLEKMGFIGKIINADELIDIIKEEKLYKLDK